MSGVKGVSLSVDSVAYAASVPKGTNYAASVPKGTNKVPGREAGTEALCQLPSLQGKEQSTTSCLRRNHYDFTPKVFWR